MGETAHRLDLVYSWTPPKSEVPSSAYSGFNVTPRASATRVMKLKNPIMPTTSTIASSLHPACLSTSTSALWQAHCSVVTFHAKSKRSRISGSMGAVR